MSLRNCSFRRPPASTQSAIKVSPCDSTFFSHLSFLSLVPWSFAAPGIVAAFLQPLLSHGFVVRTSVIMTSWYGSRGPDGVRLWTTTSARMPEGPRIRMLLFSSSAFKPTRRARFSWQLRPCGNTPLGPRRLCCQQPIAVCSTVRRRSLLSLLHTGLCWLMGVSWSQRRCRRKAQVKKIGGFSTHFKITHPLSSEPSLARSPLPPRYRKSVCSREAHSPPQTTRAPRAQIIPAFCFFLFLCFTANSFRNCPPTIPFPPRTRPARGLGARASVRFRNLITIPHLRLDFFALLPKAVLKQERKT